MSKFAKYGAVPLDEATPLEVSPGATSETNRFAKYGAQPVEATQPAASNSLEQMGMKQFEASRAKTNPNEILPSEIESIASKYGVAKEELEEAVPYFGALSSGQSFSEEAGKLAAGFAGEALGFGIPQKLLIKSKQDPNLRKALDELRDVAEDRKHILQSLAELGVGVATGVGTAKAVGSALKFAPRALKAAERGSFVGSFGATGLGQSKEGEELQDTLKWAGAGSVLLGLGITAKAGWTFLKGVDTETVQRAYSQLDAEEDVARVLESKAPQIEAQENLIVDSARRTTELGNTAKEALEDSDRRFLNKGVELQDFEVSEEVLRLIPEERVAKFADASTPEGKLIKRAGIPEADVRKFIAHEDWKNSTKRFAEYLKDGKVENLGSGKLGISKAQRIISEKLAVEGEQFLRNEFRRFKQVDELTGALSKKIDRSLKATDTWMGRARDFLSDGRVVATLIDDRLGTSLVPLMDKMATSQNAFTVRLGAKLQELEPLVRQFKVQKIDVDAAYRALDSGDFSGFTAEQLDTLNSVKVIFENWRQEAVEMGLPIAKRTNYIPHQSVPLDEYIVRLGRKLDEVESSVGTKNILQQLDEDSFKALRESNQEFADFLKGVENLTGRNIDSLASAVRHSEEALNPSTARESWHSEASAAKRRTGEIPDFLREKNPLKLAQNWAYETFRHAHLREGLSELKRIRNQAVEIGDGRAVEFLTKLVNDLHGIRRGTLASYGKEKTLEWAVKLHRYADRQDDPLMKSLAELTARAPDMWRSLANTIYPNLLGLNLRALLVNLSQPLSMTWPELGYQYGGPKITKGYLEFSLSIAMGKEITLSPMMAKRLGKRPGERLVTRNPRLILENDGNISKQWNTELVDVLEKSIEQNALYKAPKKVIEGWTNASMFLYEWTEVINRTIAVNVADDVTRDIIRGSSKGAEEFVGKMGRGYQRQIGLALRNSNPNEAAKQVQTLVREYLLGKTIFNYNRISMSQYGRAAGPLFSVFTKWPTSIAGDIFAELEQKGTIAGSVKLMHKYFAPLMGSILLQEALLPEPGESSLVDKIIGKSQFAGWAAIGSVQSITSGDIVKPPVVNMATELLTAAMERDPYKFWKGMNNVAQSIVPFAGLVRFVTQDVPIYSGEDAKTGTFLNRTFPSLDLDSRVRDLSGE